MNIARFLKLSQPIIQEVFNKGVNPADIKYLPLFDKYEELVSQGNKITYVEAVISDEFKVSQRNVQNIIKRLKKSV